jgi:hypothetical protein
MVQVLQTWTGNQNDPLVISLPITMSESSNNVTGGESKVQGLFSSFFASKQPNIDSVALPCSRDGKTILHFISPDYGINLPEQHKSTVELLAIHCLTCEDNTTASVLEKVRYRLANALLLPTTLGNPWQNLKSSITGRNMFSASHLLQSNRGVPIVDLEVQETDERSYTASIGDLKEVVIPSFLSDTDANGRTLLEHLQSLPRPVPGLYQTSSGLCIRPLPTAKEDRHLSPPSLIFQAEETTLDSAINIHTSDSDHHAFRIGYTGCGSKRQVLIRNAKTESKSIDIRLCPSTKPISMFAEAQESLLASSLEELQSRRVLAQNSSQEIEDPNNNKMDCWVEFRANMKNPSGFFPRKSSEGPKIAKAPDLPFE